MKSKPKRRFPVETLTRDDIDKLLAQCSRTCASGIRNHALIVLLWRSGLRIREALDLELKDIDMAANAISVLHGKGDKQRRIDVDPKALDVLQGWLARRSKIKNIDSSHVFCTAKGTRVGEQYARDMLKRLAILAGVEKRVHPHQFRHQCAVDLMAEGIPINLVSAQLGHSSVATTAIYLKHVSPPELKAAIGRRTW